MTKTTTTSKLAAPFTARDTIFLWFKSKTGEVIAYLKFGAPYSAKKFMDFVIDDYETKWTGPDKLLIRDWFIAQSDPKSSASLEDIMEHEYSKEEAKWELPHDYKAYATNVRQWHYGTHPDVNTRSRTAQGKPRLTDEEYDKQPGAPERPRMKLSDGTRTKSPSPKERKPKQLDINVITLADICAQLEVEPRQARAALRAAKIEKPTTGWSWPRADEAKATRLVKTALEKMK